MRHLCGKIIYAMLMVISVICSLTTSFAQTSTSETNRIESVLVNPQLDGAVIKLTLRSPIKNPPVFFSVESPASISFDFPNTISGLGKSKEVAGHVGNLTDVNVVQVGGRTRVTLSLIRLEPFDVRVDGKDVIIALRNEVTLSRTVPGYDKNENFVEPSLGAKHTIQEVSFQRDNDGDGKIVIGLSDNKIAVDVKNEGNLLIAKFLNTSIEKKYQRKLDVLDLATPVNTIEANSLGDTTKITIAINGGEWTYSAYQADNKFIIEVQKIIKDTPVVIGKTYTGAKVTFQFQNIDLRALLQIMADYSDANLVISDTVKGSVSMQLHDVPWDQALDIILQSKGLGKVSNGDVIWIAPKDELAAKELQRLETAEQTKTLDPLQTETFQVNYQTADNLLSLLRSNSGSASMLSARASIVADAKSNKIIVTDTATQLDRIRKFIKEIDVATKQVLIEARVVEATDNFTRNIGSRFGVRNYDLQHIGNIGYSTGGNLNTTTYTTGQSSTQPNFPSDTLNSVFAAPGIGGYQPGQFSFLLFNNRRSKFLSLELTALQSDGNGRLISSPRVVTADGKSAEIKQGVNVPYQERSSSGVATTGFKEAALVLKVTPLVTPDGRIRLTLDIKKDTVNTSVPTAGGLALNNRNITTEVLVDNGGTLMIGGIFTTEEIQNITKIPLLGDIPFLGALFRYKENRNNKSELLVFITPKVVDEKLSVQ